MDTTVVLGVEVDDGKHSERNANNRSHNKVKDGHGNIPEPRTRTGVALDGLSYRAGRFCVSDRGSLPTEVLGRGLPAVNSIDCYLSCGGWHLGVGCAQRRAHDYFPLVFSRWRGRGHARPSSSLAEIDEPSSDS